MASPSLALPGVVFVGEDERSRLVVHLGAASGWMIPKGILSWSTEVAVVARDALTEEVRRDAKIVMPEEQVPPARMPLTHQATQKAPLVAVSGRLVPKLVEKGVRVHTIGADRVTSSFYYIGEGGGEPEVRVEGDLVAAVGAMLGDRADNAAIERVLDGLVDRLLRSLSKDRVNELSVELAAALPRAAADGSGMQDIDLDGFEKDLGALIGSSEKYSAPLREISEKLSGATDRKLDIPLFVDAKKVSQGPFDLAIGERTVSLGTAEHWVASGPFSEPKPAAKPAPAPAATPAAATPAPSPKPAPAKPEPRVEAKPEPKPAPKAETPKPAKAEPKAATPAPAPAANAEPPPAGMKPLAAPMSPPVAPPRPASNPPPAAQPAAAAPAAAATASRSDEIKPAPVVAVVANPPPSERKPAPAPAPEPAKASEAAPEPKPAPEPAKASVEPVKVEAAPEPKPAPEPAPAKVEPKAEAPKAAPEAAKAEPKREPKAAASDPRPKRDERPSQAIAEKKNFPWIWVLIAAGVAMAAAWRFLFAGK